MAKKIIGAVVAVGAIWLGGTAYIGSKTEPYLEHYVQKTNKLYNAQGIELSVEKFNKGFFTSQAQVKLDFTDESLREELVEIIKLPMDIHYTIENGPLFFQNGLGVGTNRIVNSIKVSDFLVDKKEFLEVVKDDIILDSTTNLGFSNNASFTAKTNRIVGSDEEGTVRISPVTMSGDFDIETFQSDMKMLIEEFLVKSPEEEITLNDIVLNADITKFYDNGFYLGDFILDVASLNVKSEDLPFEVKNAKVAMKMNINENVDKNIDLKFDLSGDFGKSQLPKEYAFLNKVNIAYALNGTKLEGLLAFQNYTKRIQEKQQAILEKLSENTSGALDESAFIELEKLQTQTEEEMILMLAGLLKKDKTSFVFETKVMDQQEKEGSAKINIRYIGDEVLPKNAEVLIEKFEKEFLNLLAMNVDIQLNKDYIDNLPADLQQELSGQLQMGAMFGVIKDNNTSFSFEADYKPKTLMVNGSDRSEMLKMLEMGMNNGGF